MNWSGRPFARILLFYVSGIFLARYFDSFARFNFNWFFAFVVFDFILKYEKRNFLR